MKKALMASKALLASMSLAALVLRSARRPRTARSSSASWWRSRAPSRRAAPNGVRNVELALQQAGYTAGGKNDRDRRRADRHDARHHHPSGAQADRAGRGRHHHRSALGLGRHRHARLRQDDPGEDRDQRHLGRARDDLGRSRRELLPLQSRRLAMGLGARHLRRRGERAGAGSRRSRPTIPSATRTSSASRSTSAAPAARSWSASGCRSARRTSAA